MTTQPIIMQNLTPNAVLGLKKEFHEWQKRALVDLLVKKRILFEVSTGSGKTMFMVSALKKLFADNENASALIVVPKNVILEDTWFRELLDAGFPISQIGLFYGGGKEMRRITLTNIQSIENIDIGRFSIIVADECHHLQTDRLREIFSNCQAEYVIGLSATVQRKKYEHWQVLHLFDNNVFTYTLSEAIGDEILSNFCYYPISIELTSKEYDEYNTLTQQLGAFSSKNKNDIEDTKNVMAMTLIGQRKKLISNTPVKKLIVQLILQQVLNKKTIIFSQYNEFTSSLYWTLIEIGIRSEVLHSGIPKANQQKILEDYRSNKFNVLLVTKMLDEGYNLPSIDCAIITATDKSELQMIQRLGRILRKKDHSAHLYQIFAKNTVEEEIVKRNVKFFKPFCEDIKTFYYDFTTKKMEIV